jgi:protease IV
MRFLRIFFASTLGAFLGLLFFFVFGFLSLIGLAALSASSGEQLVAIDDSSILKLDLNRPLVTFNDESPDVVAKYLNDEIEKVGLVQIKKALANAKKDPKIKGIYLQATAPMAGYATLQEVRQALLDFKTSGKPILAYGDYYLEKGYYLASVADQIVLAPTGGIDFNGLSAEVTFFKGALQKLDIEPLIFRVGTFKSAVEPFMLDKMSEANREQTQSYLNSIQGKIFGEIAQSRKRTVAQINTVADSLLAFKASGALRTGLVTSLGYFADFEIALKKQSKLASDQDIDYVSLNKYLRSTSLPLAESTSKSIVQVIVAEGDVTSGDSGEDNIGSSTVVAQLKAAREDEDVKAVVLRIDSPGGSALASDEMWQAVKLTRAQKPVVASMADVAASGGYYMAMGCDAIVANATTITGSIGIFGMFLNTEKFLKNKLGITTDYVNTNQHSDFPTATRQLSDFEKSIFQKGVNEGYKIFTEKAAQGRKMPVEKLETLASGRVWTGTQAQANGLVDALGGLDKAIELAAQKAKLAQYKTQYDIQKKDFLDKFFDTSAQTWQQRMLQAQWGSLTPYWQQLQRLQQSEGTLARMPFEVQIR